MHERAHIRERTFRFPATIEEGNGGNIFITETFSSAIKSWGEKIGRLPARMFAEVRRVCARVLFAFTLSLCVHPQLSASSSAASPYSPPPPSLPISSQTMRCAQLRLSRRRVTFFRKQTALLHPRAFLPLIGGRKRGKRWIWRGRELVFPLAYIFVGRATSPTGNAFRCRGSDSCRRCEIKKKKAEGEKKKRGRKRTGEKIR